MSDKEKKSKLTLDEIYTKVKNYASSIYGFGNTVKICFYPQGEGGYIEITNFISPTWTSFRFNSWEQLETFLTKHGKE